MSEYNWDELDAQARARRIPAEHMPERVALTATAVLLLEDRSQVLLVDPHPEGTWNSWMFPYASLTLELSELERDSESSGQRPRILDLRPGATLHDLATSLDEVLRLYSQQYREALQENLNNVIPEVMSDWGGEPFRKQYALKYSKSSNSYTAYHFSYYERTSGLVRPTVPYTWVSPKLLMAMPTSEKLDGRSIAEGDPLALRYLFDTDA